MRHLLLILLIALFPLRGFAGVGMQTQMGVMALHHAAMVAEPASPMAAQTDNTTAAEPVAACCPQCSVCDLCHLLVGQPAVSALVLPPLPTAHAPAVADRFASADRRVAHKPPTSHA